MEEWSGTVTSAPTSMVAVWPLVEHSVYFHVHDTSTLQNTEAGLEVLW